MPEAFRMAEPHSFWLWAEREPTRTALIAPSGEPVAAGELPVGPAEKIIPDSELVYGPAFSHFDVTAVVNNWGGYLAGYMENVEGAERTGPEIVQLVAQRYTIDEQRDPVPTDSPDADAFSTKSGSGCLIVNSRGITKDICHRRRKIVADFAT